MYLPIEIANQICEYINDCENDIFILQFYKNGNPYYKLNKQSITCNNIKQNIICKIQRPLIKEFIKLENMDIFTTSDLYLQYQKYIVFMHKVYFKLNPLSIFKL